MRTRYVLQSTYTEHFTDLNYEVIEINQKEILNDMEMAQIVGCGMVLKEADGVHV